VTPAALAAKVEAALQALGPYFGRAQEIGFIGPAPIHEHVARGLAFVLVAPGEPSGLALDLGSGAGLPGLLLAWAWPDSTWVLLDSNHRKATWLGHTVEALGLSARVSVLCERAEVVGRSSLRHRAKLVTARGFASPAATAECAAPLLEAGGQLLVAEPPARPGDHTNRWPATGLAQLGPHLPAQPPSPPSLSRSSAP
jgi:16S rRNA (guanine527-N7)-methyltransferase